MGQIFSSFLWESRYFQIPAGRIGDIVEPRFTLTVAALVWCGTSVLTGLLPDGSSLEASRYDLVFSAALLAGCGRSGDISCRRAGNPN